ncbi:polymer-forming cytoskeletal protein [Paenibacillus sediminis]|uniref:Cytoskeletal protein CcmA (Bactofilin family) n=1 Tax=Paenibacillus sediminis TaxID=664909 RepID=A0ABS4H4U2_9BACL|nr:polymer-forming cytoskeletal protein [Paenibacillus sediminis]MBP1937392.1 cytoskeletal protein CcmA (bactofilin family) [Paenibacillus sediminis]
MFKEFKKSTTNATHTLIGQGSEIQGILMCEANLRIEGTFQGEIECTGDIVIGEDGVARSNIIANGVIVAGKVYGDIRTQGRLTITSTGQVYGNVIASSLVIAEGGLLNGASKMEKESSYIISEPVKSVSHSEAG